LKRTINDAVLDFPIFRDGYAYLDNAATTQKPRAVLDAVRDYYESCNANAYRAIHRWGEEATRRYEEARRRTASFINASSPHQIIFTSGATDGINLAADSFCRRYVTPGDEILISGMEHHSNIVPWQIRGKQAGAVLKYIPVLENGELDLDSLDRLLTPRTRLLALTHVSNVLGTVNPVKQIIRKAHAREIPVLVDAAQSVPHMPVDVQDLDCDFLVFSGHKMCGPMGTGVLYGRKALLEELPPFRGGGQMIRSVHSDHSEWNGIPQKFEAGTPNIAGALGLAAAMDYLEAWGLDTIDEKERELTEILQDGLEGLKGYTIHGRPARRSGILSFSHRDFHAHDLAQYLDDEGFALRAGQHCAHPLARELKTGATLRSSVYLYNSREEIVRLLESLDRASGKLF
jgi:cysteine desulfurase/selenocysteine lyase